MGLVIENNVVRKYEQDGATTVVIPAGVTRIGCMAFSGCEEIKEVILPDSVTTIDEWAFHFCPNLTSIKIPESVQSIGEKAFGSCEGLTEISLPSGLKKIEKEMFEHCKKLKNINIPSGVEIIERSAFYECSSLKEITLPKALHTLTGTPFLCCGKLSVCNVEEGNETFSSRDGMLYDKKGKKLIFCPYGKTREISLPEDVTEIGDDAFPTFYGDKGVESLHLPANIKKIGANALARVKSVENMTEVMLNGCKINTKTMENLVSQKWRKDTFLPEIIAAYLTQSGKAVLASCEKNMKKDCNKTVGIMSELLEKYSPKKGIYKKAADFAVICIDKVDKEVLNKLYQVIEKAGVKEALDSLAEFVGASEPKQEEKKTSDNPVEQLCADTFNEASFDAFLKQKKINASLFTGIHYADSEEIASDFVIKSAIVPYMLHIKEPLPRYRWNDSKYFILKFETVSDQIAEKLEKKELQKLLEDLFTKYTFKKVPELMFPYFRYGSPEQVMGFDYKSLRWPLDLVYCYASIFSDTKEYFLWVEKTTMFKDYAKLRQTTMDKLRDLALGDFGLDKEGKKVYDLDSAEIEVSLGDDFSLNLYNKTTGKKVKSLPKKGADEKKYAEVAADYKSLKSNVKKAVKSRVNQFQSEFLTGKYKKMVDWEAANMDNAVFNKVAVLLVWEHKSGSKKVRFMVDAEGNFRDYSGNSLKLAKSGSVCVAHPVEIPEEELQGWKTYLTENKIAQPFTQIFEPVYTIKEEEIKGRFEGVEVPLFVLTKLSKELVYVGNTVEEGYTSLYLSGDAVYADLEYVNPQRYFSFKMIPYDTAVCIKNIKVSGNERQINHDVFVMDKAVLENHVRANHIKAVMESAFAVTEKNIQRLIDVSVETEAAECTAWLLSYKNEHYPNSFDDLSLD